MTRLGLALVAPRRGFVAVEAAEGRGGLSDAATLLILKFVAMELKAIVAALWTAMAVGFGAGFGMLSPQIGRAVGMDLLLIFGGGLFVTLAAGGKRRPGRDFDLAASAWVPYLAYSLMLTLVVAVSDLHVQRAVSDVLGLVGLAIYAFGLGLAVQHARRRS